MGVKGSQPLSVSREARHYFWSCFWVGPDGGASRAWAPHLLSRVSEGIGALAIGGNHVRGSTSCHLGPQMWSVGRCEGNGSHLESQAGSS